MLYIQKYKSKPTFLNRIGIIHELKSIETKEIDSSISFKNVIPEKIFKMNKKEIFFFEDEFKFKVYDLVDEVIKKGEEYKNCLSQFSFIERLLIGDIFLVTLYNNEKEILLGINYKFELEEVETNLPLNIEDLKHECEKLLLIF